MFAATTIPPSLPRTMILVPLLTLVNAVYSTPLLDDFLSKEVPGPDGKDGLPPGSSEFWWKMVMSAALVLAGGLFAGYVCSGTSLCLEYLNILV